MLLNELENGIENSGSKIRFGLVRRGIELTAVLNSRFDATASLSPTFFEGASAGLGSHEHSVANWRSDNSDWSFGGRGVGTELISAHTREIALCNFVNGAANL